MKNSLNAKTASETTKLMVPAAPATWIHSYVFS